MRFPDYTPFNSENIIRVGLVGYCPPSKFDEEEADAMIKEIFFSIEKNIEDGVELVLVSGWTNVGVLKLGYTEAKRRGWKTVGIACKRAEEHELFPVDAGLIVGEEWGAESRTFLQSIDMLVRIGGGEQSMAEAAIAAAAGQPVFAINLPLLD